MDSITMISATEDDLNPWLKRNVSIMLHIIFNIVPSGA